MGISILGGKAMENAHNQPTPQDYVRKNFGAMLFPAGWRVGTQAATTFAAAGRATPLVSAQHVHSIPVSYIPVQATARPQQRIGLLTPSGQVGQ